MFLVRNADRYIVLSRHSAPHCCLYTESMTLPTLWRLPCYCFPHIAPRNNAFSEGVCYMTWCGGVAFTMSSTAQDHHHIKGFFARARNIFFVLRIFLHPQVCGEIWRFFSDPQMSSEPTKTSFENGGRRYLLYMI